MALVKTWSTSTRLISLLKSTGTPHQEIGQMILIIPTLILTMYIWQPSSFRTPTLWFINLTVTILNTLFRIYANYCFHEETDKTRKYSKFTIFRWHKNGCRQLLGVQSINTESASLSDSCISTTGATSLPDSGDQERNQLIHAQHVLNLGFSSVAPGVSVSRHGIFPLVRLKGS